MIYRLVLSIDLEGNFEQLRAYAIDLGVNFSHICVMNHQ